MAMNEYEAFEPDYTDDEYYAGACRTAYSKMFNGRRYDDDMACSDADLVLYDADRSGPMYRPYE